MATETDTPIELPVTALGEVARLLRDVQKDVTALASQIGGGRPGILVIQEKLGNIGIRVDVIIGDGQ